MQNLRASAASPQNMELVELRGKQGGLGLGKTTLPWKKLGPPARSAAVGGCEAAWPRTPPLISAQSAQDEGQEGPLPPPGSCSNSSPRTDVSNPY
eukprot:s1688_g8.t1